MATYFETKPALEKQVAVVTGGARGIGEAIVRRFVAEGAQVVFSDILDGKAKALAKELGQKCQIPIRQCDQPGRY